MLMPFYILVSWVPDSCLSLMGIVSWKAFCKSNYLGFYLNSRHIILSKILHKVWALKRKFPQSFGVWFDLVFGCCLEPKYLISYFDIQFSSVAQSCPILCDCMNCSILGFSVYHKLPELTQTYVHQVGDAIQTSHLLLLPLFLPSIFPSIRVFYNGSILHIRWPKNWNFSPSNEYSGLISFRMDWLDLLAVQGTLKSLLQQNSSKASILQCSAFFRVQLSDLYMMNTGKTIALTIWTFVGKVMTLIFNMLSRLVIAFLPRSKHLLISWLQSPSAVIWEPTKIVCDCFHHFPNYMPWSDGTRCHDLSFWMLSFKPNFSLSSFTFIKRLLADSFWYLAKLIQLCKV